MHFFHHPFFSRWAQSPRRFLRSFSLRNVRSGRRPIVVDFGSFARHWVNGGENLWLGALLTEAQKCIIVEHTIDIDGLEHLLGEPEDLAAFEVEVVADEAVPRAATRGGAAPGHVCR